MAPYATEQEHATFWGAGRDAPLISLVAGMSAALREAVAPPPPEDPVPADYAAKARAAELLAGRFLAERGVYQSAGAGEVSVTYAPQEEALALIRAQMGAYARAAHLASLRLERA